MKNIISIALAALIIMSPISVFAEDAAAPCARPVEIGTWRGCEPIVSTVGTVSVDKYSAVVSAYFSSNGADFNTTDRPSLSVEYGLVSSGRFDKTSAIYFQPRGAYTVGFTLPGLTENKTYHYRAVVNWVGGTKYGEIKTFVAQKQITGTTSTPAGIDGSTASAGTGTVAGSTIDDDKIAPAPITTASTTGGFFSLFGGKKTTAARFKNVDERSGFKLSIDDGETNVSAGDTVTLKVRYENNTTKAYNGALIEIYLPEQFTFVSSNKGMYDRVDHVVAVDLGEFPAGGFGTAIVIMEATGKAGNLDQAIAQATMKVAGLTLKVSDIDEYNGSKGSVLGASASGSFVPGSLIGWIILLVLLAGLVIVGRRYFFKKDY